MAGVVGRAFSSARLAFYQPNKTVSARRAFSIRLRRTPSSGYSAATTRLNRAFSPSSRSPAAVSPPRGAAINPVAQPDEAAHRLGQIVIDQRGAVPQGAVHRGESGLDLGHHRGRTRRK